MLSIRPAIPNDAPLLKSLIHEFAEFERLDAAITEQDLLRDGFGPQPKFRVLLAEWDAQPAGYALFFKAPHARHACAALKLAESRRTAARPLFRLSG